jgi:hypothetical protein
VPVQPRIGAARGFMVGDDDLLDAITPRYRTLNHRDLWDERLAYGQAMFQPSDRRRVLVFMNIYGRLKRALNFCRRRLGRTACQGRKDAQLAIGRAPACP